MWHHVQSTSSSEFTNRNGSWSTHSPYAPSPRVCINSQPSTKDTRSPPFSLMALTFFCPLAHSLMPLFLAWWSTPPYRQPYNGAGHDLNGSVKVPAKLRVHITWKIIRPAPCSTPYFDEVLNGMSRVHRLAHSPTKGIAPFGCDLCLQICNTKLNSQLVWEPLPLYY